MIDDGHPAGVDRRRTTLEHLLQISAVEVQPALNQAAQIVAEALQADKVDAFIYEAATESLVALGTSDTPMGHRQRAIGLDRLPLANGGRAAEVFRQGGSCRDGQVDQDPGELEGIKQGLGVRSALLCPLVVAAERRGVLIAASAGAEQFSADDLSFFDAVAGWVGLVLHRAELVERLVEQGEQRGQRQAMAELLNVLTPRQREVAVCIARGYSNEEIAERLCITPGTAANHVERILRRLSFRSRTEVAALVAEIGVHRQDPEALEQAS